MTLPRWGIYPPSMNLEYIGTVDDVDLWIGKLGSKQVYTLIPSMSETLTAHSIDEAVSMLPRGRRGIIDVLRAMAVMGGPL